MKTYIVAIVNYEGYEVSYKVLSSLSVEDLFDKIQNSFIPNDSNGNYGNYCILEDDDLYCEYGFTLIHLERFNKTIPKRIKKVVI